MKPNEPLQSRSEPVHALIAEERAETDHRLSMLAKVRSLRENNLAGGGRVLAGDSKKEYCWVNYNDERQNFFLSRGWEKVTLETGPNVKTYWSKPDGTHARGDLILYQIDKELYEAYSTDSELRGMEAIDGYKHTFMESAERRGARVFEPPV